MIIIEDKSVQNTLKFPKNTDGIAVSLKLYSELTHFTKTFEVEDLGTSSMYFTISISFDEVPDGEYVYTIASADSKELSTGYIRIGDIDSENTVYDYNESYISYDPETGESNIVSPYLLTDVTLQVEENGDMVINTPEGYDGISKVNLTVNVEGTSTDGSTPNLTKLYPYFYVAEYGTLDYNYAYKHYVESALYGGCSALRKGNLVGRNYDWKYDETANFFVKTPAQYEKNAVMGLCGGIDELTGEFVDGGAYSEKYKLLPFMMQDGINDAGLFCSMHLVPAKDNQLTEGTVCNTFLVRYILENFKTVEEIEEADFTVFNNPSLLAKGYELQYFISDASGVSTSLEFYGESKIFKATDKLTNFHIASVEFNADGTVNTPESGSPARNFIRGYESGLERWNLIVSHSEEDVEHIIKELMFTNAYTDNTPIRYSEFVGEGLDVNGPLDEFIARHNAAKQEFDKRIRDGKTWQTVHSCVYDLENKVVKVIPQEDYMDETFIFSMKGEEYATKADITNITGNLNSLTTASKVNLVNAVNEVNTIAKGATRALSFYNYSHLVAMLQNGQYSDLRTGQNLYINLVGVPDLWIVTAGLPDVSYTYTTDEAFIEYVKTSGRVGKYHLGFLETEKVYLDNYYTKTEVDDLIEGVEGYDGNIYLSGSSDNVEWMRAQNKKVWDMLEDGTYRGGFLVQYSTNNTKKVSVLTQWGAKAMNRYTFIAEYYDGSTQQMNYNSVSLWETSATISAYNSHTLQRKLTAGDGIVINGTTISSIAGTTFNAIPNKSIIPVEEARKIGIRVNFKYVEDGNIFGTFCSNPRKNVTIKVIGGEVYFNGEAKGGSLVKGNTYDLYFVYDSDNEADGYNLYINNTYLTSFGYNNFIFGEGQFYIGAGCEFDYDDGDLSAKFNSNNAINHITTINGFDFEEDQLSYFDTYVNRADVVVLSYKIHKFIGKTEGAHHFIYDTMTGWERMID